MNGYMDRQVERQRDGEKPTDGKINEWIDGQTDGKTDRLT
jgi:hypothetical protein